jgi:hypothetical protein
LCAAIVDRLTVGVDIIETCPPQPSDARVHRHDPTAMDAAPEFRLWLK